MLASIEVYRQTWPINDRMMEELPWMLRKSVAELLSTPKSPVNQMQIEVRVQDANQFDSNTHDLVISISTKRATSLARNKKLVTELAKRCRAVIHPIVTGEDMTVDRVIKSLIEIGPRHRANREIWAPSDHPWGPRP